MSTETKDGPEVCDGCRKKPPREAVTIGELIAQRRFCEECWAEKLALLKSGEIEKKAQVQYDKLMADLESGMDPKEAWDRKDEGQ